MRVPAASFDTVWQGRPVVVTYDEACAFTPILVSQHRYTLSDELGTIHCLDTVFADQFVRPRWPFRRHKPKRFVWPEVAR